MYINLHIHVHVHVDVCHTYKLYIVACKTLICIYASHAPQLHVRSIASLLAHGPLSSFVYPVIIYTPLVADNLPIIKLWSLGDGQQCTVYLVFVDSHPLCTLC